MAARFSFGPFSIDTAERLLRRNCEVFPLAPKGVEILLLLLERPGDLVTKEDLRERVWDGAFVEENSVTQTVSRLRRALASDFDGENPILTVSKRGYRMGVSVTVEALPSQLEPIPLENAYLTTSYPEDPQENPTPLNPRNSQPQSARTRYYGWQWVAGCLFVIALTASLLLWRHRHPHPAQSVQSIPRQPARRSIAILGFENLSGRADEAWLSTALSEMMYSEIFADGAVRVVPNSLVAQIQRDESITSSSGAPPGINSTSATKLNCDMVLRGDYLETGGKLRLDVLLQDARTGETLGAFTRSDTADHLLPLISLAGEDVRRGLGSQSLSPAQHGQVLASVAANPDALRAYAQGLTLLRSWNAVAAQPYLEESIRLEPDYPTSHAALSNAWTLLGYDTKAAAEANRATQLTAQLSNAEKLQVDARFFEASTQWDKAVTTYQQLWDLFPDDIEYGLSLGHALISAGKPQQALEAIRKLSALQPSQDPDPRIALMEAGAYSSNSQFALAANAADAAITSARARGSSSVLARALLQWGKDTNTLGYPTKARAAFAESADLAKRLGDRGTAVRAAAADAKLVLQTGDAEAAKKEDAAAIDTAKQIGDRHALVSLLLDMTQVYRPQGNLAAQRDYAQQALHLAQEISDRTAQTSALLDLGNALNNQGNVDAARAAYQQCITLSRTIGNRAVLSRALGNLAMVEYTHGNLTAARSLLDEGMSISRATGEKASVAYKLGELATVLMYQNRLPEARAALQERCDIETQLGAKRDLATCQIGMAQLAIAEGHPQDAIGPLTLVTQTFQQVNPAVDAWNMMAEAQLALGHTKEVGVAIDHARELAHDTTNPAEYSIPMGLIIGRYQAAMGMDTQALQTLKASREGASRLNLLPIALRAKLYIAEVDSKKKPALATTEFDHLANEAERSGFARIATIAKSERTPNE